jgi:hypothetical protein
MIDKFDDLGMDGIMVSYSGLASHLLGTPRVFFDPKVVNETMFTCLETIIAKTKKHHPYLSVSLPGVNKELIRRLVELGVTALSVPFLSLQATRTQVYEAERFLVTSRN